jgi:hypothetical protein
MYYLYNTIIIGINNIAVINKHGRLQGLILLSKFSWAGERISSKMIARALKKGH